MKMKLLLTSIFLLIMSSISFSQNYVYWSDDFSDDDPQATKNVGWLYLGEDQGITDAAVAQVNGELFVRQGYYELLPGFGLGISVIETNGLPLVLWDNYDSTAVLLNRDYYSLPDQQITLKIRFTQWRDKGESSSFFSINTRLNQTPNDSLSLPIADATVEPAYALAIYPLSGLVIMGKYGEDPALQLPALFPTTAWEIMGQTTVSIELNKYYWIKFYLKDADIRSKIWADGTNEPDAWTLTGTDASPRVNGKFTGMGVIGTGPNTGQGDQFYMDDVKVEGWEPLFPTHVSSTEKYQVDNFQLEQNYPNPFNPETTIRFTLKNNQDTRLVVFNLKGQVVRTLLNTTLNAGAHEAKWNGRDESGQAVSSGIYVYKLISAGSVQSKRMVLLK